MHDAAPISHAVFFLKIIYVSVQIIILVDYLVKKRNNKNLFAIILRLIIDKL